MLPKRHKMQRDCQANTAERRGLFARVRRVVDIVSLQR